MESYVLASLTQGDFFATDSRKFKVGAMTFEMLEPFRRWRFLFNGCVRRISDGKVLHLRMNCM